MRLVAFLFLLAAPLLEIGLLIKVGQMIGIWWTLAIVVGTAILGLGVIMENGFTTPARIHEAMMKGDAPVAPMVEGGLVVAAGVLLLTPGLIADALGALLLLPPLRRLAARWLAGGLFGTFTVEVGSGSGPRGEAGDRRRDPFDGPRPRKDGAGGVIEGEYQRIGERTVDPNRRSPNGHDAG